MSLNPKKTGGGLQMTVFVCIHGLDTRCNLLINNADQERMHNVRCPLIFNTTMDSLRFLSTLKIGWAERPGPGGSWIFFCRADGRGVEGRPSLRRQPCRGRTGGPGGTDDRILDSRNQELL